jgi:hypothetical protein
MQRGGRNGTRTHRSWVTFAAGALALALSRQAPAQGRDKVAAEALFREGRKDMEQKNYDAACRKFDESNRLDPAVGTVFNLANCEEQRGHVATAWQRFKEVAERVPADDERRSIAESRAQSLEPRLPYLTIKLDARAPGGTHVVRDGVELGSETMGLALPLDPGDHLVVVKADGHADAEFRFHLAERERRELAVSPGATVTTSEATEQSPRSDTAADQSPTASPSPGPRAGRFAIFGRADVDGKARGAVIAAGAGYDAADGFELSISGLFGHNSGFEPAATVYFLTDRWQPRVTVAAPVFFVDGARAGVRASAGLVWGFTRNAGVFVDVGVTYHPKVPENYENVAFVPSVGMIARL